MLLELNIIGCLQEQIWDLLLNSQEIYWKVWHLLTSSLGIRREYFWVLISYKMRKVLNYNWKLWIYSSPSQSSPVQSSSIIDDKKEVTGDSLLVFINFKVKAFLYLGLFSHCLENWTKYNPTKLHQLNDSHHNSAVKPNFSGETKYFLKTKNIFYRV